MYYLLHVHKHTDRAEKMNIFDNEVEQFVIDYIERNIYDNIKQEIENDNGYGYSVRKLSDFIDALDTDTKKRLLGSARAAKKRLKDKENGNENINVTLSRAAHEKLKKQSSFRGVTLSQYIESYMDNGNATAVDEMNEQERFSAERNRRLVVELQNELNKMLSKEKHVPATEAAKIARDVIAVKEKSNQKTIEKLNEALLKIKNLEDALDKSRRFNAERCQELNKETKEKYVPVNATKRCCALSKSKARCKNTDNLNLIDESGLSLCGFHLTMFKKDKNSVSFLTKDSER